MRLLFSSRTLPRSHPPGRCAGAAARLGGRGAWETAAPPFSSRPFPAISRLMCSVVLTGALSSCALAAGDPYLEMLDEEVTKVEAAPTDTADDGEASSANADSAQRAQPVPSKMKFETLLRQQQVGTYSFYRRLPERSREEIFSDYSGGASMEMLREKIIERYLHP